MNEDTADEALRVIENTGLHPRSDHAAHVQALDAVRCELARLRTIEAAARRTVRSTPASATRWVEWEALRTVLGEGARRADAPDGAR